MNPYAHHDDVEIERWINRTDGQIASYEIIQAKFGQIRTIAATESDSGDLFEEMHDTLGELSIQIDTELTKLQQNLTDLHEEYMRRRYKHQF